MILHIVNKSPFNSDCLSSCLRVIKEGDALLLIEEGVYAGSGTHLQTLAATIPIYALAADVAARGLNGRLVPAVQVADDGGFVDLTIAYAKSQSWY